MDRRRRRPVRRIVVALAVSAAVAIVAAAAWIVVRGVLAKAQVDEALAASQQLSAAVEARDLGLVADELSRVGTYTAEASALTSDPVWRLAETLPWIGDDLAAARIAVTGADALVTDVALPLVAVGTDVAATAEDGALALETLSRQASVLSSAAAAASGTRGRLDAVDTDQLWGPLGEGLSELQALVEQLDGVTGALDDVGRLLPSMLGAEEDRTILVMIQNNAELRTGGGITGTFVLLGARDGALVLLDQADSSQFPREDDPILALPAGTTELYSDDVGRWVMNASATADFDLTARLASAWWADRSGEGPDAVVSIDPIVLAAILEATGPISTPTGTLTADSLVQDLLVDPYLNLDRDGQTELYESAAAAVFEALDGDGADLISLAGALAEPLAAGRVSVWSAHEDEQAVLAESALGGPAQRQRLAGNDAFAVYLNDLTGGKMDTSLEVSLAAGSAQCRDDGRAETVVRVELTSTAPADAADLWPVSMTGGGIGGYTAGDIATKVSVSAPEGASYGEVSVDGVRVAPITTQEAGFPVSATKAVVAPGQTVTIEFRFLAADPGPVQPVLLSTPLVTDPEIGRTAVSCVG